MDLTGNRFVVPGRLWAFVREAEYELELANLPLARVPGNANNINWQPLWENRGLFGVAKRHST